MILFKGLRRCQAQLLSQPKLWLTNSQRLKFSTDVATQDSSDLAEGQQQEETLEVRNNRLGIDTEFSDRKHSYVLQFPWNFEEVITDY